MAGDRALVARAKVEAFTPVARAEASCARELTKADAAAMLRAEVHRWLSEDTPADSLDGLTLADLITHEVRWAGTHHLDERLVDDLDVLRARHRGRDAVLDAFLDCILAKRDGQFWNRTYLCLPVLEHLLRGPHALDAAELAALLAADIVRFELCASRRDKPVSPLDRPDTRTLHKRLRHAVRFLSANLGAPVATDLLTSVAADPEAGLPDALTQLPVVPETDATEWLVVTVQPVSTVHDEYFFIRALQAHELSYTVAANRIAAATVALRAGRVGEAADLVDQVIPLVSRGASLFGMISTLRREAFYTFRDFTQGASAIQSEQYKRFEARCGTPHPERFASPAFTSVPAVAAEVTDPDESLADAWLAVQQQRPDDADLARLTASMIALEDTHLRWKGAHLALATRMLGEARGTGYTAGVPYLKAWVEHRLFWEAPAITGPAVAG